MGRYAAGNAPEADRMVDEAIKGIAARVASLSIPRLAGIVLGGGYGRGEGGVFGGSQPSNAEKTEAKRQILSNDLDFYVVTDDGASDDDIAKIGEALKPVAEEWTSRLGIDVDFCTAKTPWRLKHDENRLMVQELVHGYVDVVGKKGEELFAGVKRLEPSALPWSEAVRLLVNRGAGLLLAKEKSEKSGKIDVSAAAQTFINRNINKCILGAGDARLIAQHRYKWRIEERAETLGDAIYSRAAEWKLRPQPTAVCDWETARKTWMDAFDEIVATRAKRPRRSFYNAARWLARRRNIGPLSTFGLAPEVRIVRSMRKTIERRGAFHSSLKKDWMIFN